MNNLLLILGSSLVVFAAAAQQPPYVQRGPLALVAPADTGISAALYDIARQPALARFFERPDGARLAKHSIVLTNESNSHIVGVAVRWVATQYNGQSRTTTWSFDSFIMNTPVPQPIIRAGTQVIATPVGFAYVREGRVSEPGGHGQLVMKIDDLDQAQQVTVMVDTIIFEDGRVIGTDESHLIDSINAIAGAVKTLVHNLRDAMSDGRNVDDILRNIVAMKRTRSVASHLDDPGGFWMMGEASVLLGFSVEQRMQRLNALEQAAPPPAFYR
jgi:hypothetical protein